MHDPLHVDPYVRVLESLDPQPAALAVRKEGEGIAGDLLENRIVVMAGEGHHQQDTIVRCVTARACSESSGNA